MSRMVALRQVAHQRFVSTGRSRWQGSIPPQSLRSTGRSLQSCSPHLPLRSLRFMSVLSSQEQSHGNGRSNSWFLYTASIFFAGASAYYTSRKPTELLSEARNAAIEEPYPLPPLPSNASCEPRKVVQPKNVMLHRMRSMKGRGLTEKYQIDWDTVLGEGAYGRYVCMCVLREKKRES